VPHQIVTRQLLETPRTENGQVVPDVERDILKLVVVERHHATGNVGVGFVRGFKLKSGALGSTVATTPTTWWSWAQTMLTSHGPLKNW